jgi:hypothetical protein
MSSSSHRAVNEAPQRIHGRGISKHRTPSRDTDIQTVDLNTAISSASQRRIALILRKVCEQLEGGQALVSQHLLASVPGTRDIKRKAYETYKNCGHEYQVDQNVGAVCVYHPGTVHSFQVPL